jgi:hypothetical protein
MHNYLLDKKIPMNKKIAITVITLVAVVMGMSAIVPMISQADAMKVRHFKIIVMLENQDTKGPHPECSVEYDDIGGTVATTSKHTNSKGVAIFPAKTTIMENDVSALATCTDNEGNNITGMPREPLRPHDEIMVILMPAPGAIPEP